MIDRRGPRTLIENSLSKCRSLIDPESHSGFSFNHSDREKLNAMATQRDADEQTRRWLKEKIRLYVTTWIIPDLETAITKLTKPSQREQQQ